VHNAAVTNAIVEALLASAEPAIRWKVRSSVLGKPGSREDVRESALVRRLIATEAPAVYAKWQGPHWVLGALADLGYPAGDEALFPYRERILDTWLHESYYRDVTIATKSAAYPLLSNGAVGGRAAPRLGRLGRREYASGKRVGHG